MGNQGVPQDVEVKLITHKTTDIASCEDGLGLCIELAHESTCGRAESHSSHDNGVKLPSTLATGSRKGGCSVSEQSLVMSNGECGTTGRRTGSTDKGNGSTGSRTGSRNRSTGCQDSNVRFLGTGSSTSSLTGSRISVNTVSGQSQVNSSMTGSQEPKVVELRTGSHISSFNDFIIRTHEAIRKSGKPNYKGCRIIIPSKLNLEYLDSNLEDYEDKEALEFIKFGWPLGNIQEVSGSHKVANHRSATDNPSHIDSYVDTELKDQAVIGGFDRNPFSSEAFYSPLGSTEKRDSPDRRVIMDLSFPRGRSVNDLIPRDEYLGEHMVLTFPRIDELIDLVRQKGRGCLLFKKDLKRAYRQIRIDVGSSNLLGFTWRGKLYFDISLPMGLRSSAMCCQRSTLCVRHIFRKHGYELVVYLDDLGSAESPEKAEEAYNCLGEILERSGFVAKESKSCPPSTKMAFLGVGFDTETLMLEVTKDRLDELLTLLKSWSNRTMASRQEIQSIIGKLNFVASVVRPGRVFISRLLNFLRGLPETGLHALTQEVHKDLNWWASFLPLYNGISMMPMEGWSSPDEVFASDACLVGCGAWVSDIKQYFHTTFPIHIQEAAGHINALELLTIIVACKVWGPPWAGKRILVQCDNEVSVVVINSGRTRDKFLQACLRELHFIAAVHEFEIRGIHIPGILNRIPDALSRWSLGPQYEAEFTALVGSQGASEVFVYDGLFDFSHDW